MARSLLNQLLSAMCSPPSSRIGTGEAGADATARSDSMKAAATRELFAYWNRLRGARAAPERADVDPAAIRRALGDTFILEADVETGYPFRLSGSRICDVTGHEMKGYSFLSMWRGPDRTTLLDSLSTVSDDAAVAVIGAQGATELGRKVDLEIGLLPLRHRGRTHARVLGSLAAVETPYWLGACPVTRFELTSLRMIWPSGRRRPLEPAAETPRSPLADVGRRMGRFLVFDGGR
jgi:hypothetical protein